MLLVFALLFLTSALHFTGSIFLSAIRTESFVHLHLKAPMCLAKFINTSLPFLYDNNAPDVQNKFDLLAVVEFEGTKGIAKIGSPFWVDLHCH
jgi:hypothetical protein